VNEAHVTINGTTLTRAQTMTLRVALGEYLLNLADRGPAALGDDEHGRAMVALYTARGSEVLALLAVTS
jgi:hypothetical protein